MSKRRILAQMWRQAPRLFGIDARRARASLGAMSWFFDSVRAYERAGDEQFPIDPRYLRPYLHDRDAAAAGIDRHYFHQDLWAARRIHEARPAVHVDVGSRIDGFVTHLLTFMPVIVVDVRPLDAGVEGLTFMRGDATEMTGFDDGALSSLSCLHALEHFGLGRYGDPIAPDAWRRALSSFARVLAPSGQLYLSVPVGKQRVEFNAHRVFDPDTILRASGLTLEEFAAVDDAGRFHCPADPSDYRDAHYACGMFRFRK